MSGLVLFLALASVRPSVPPCEINSNPPQKSLPVAPPGSARGIREKSSRCSLQDSVFVQHRKIQELTPVFMRRGTAKAAYPIDRVSHVDQIGKGGQLRPLPCRRFARKRLSTAITEPARFSAASAGDSPSVVPKSSRERNPSGAMSEYSFSINAEWSQAKSLATTQPYRISLMAHRCSPAAPALGQLIRLASSGFCGLAVGRRGNQSAVPKVPSRNAAGNLTRVSARWICMALPSSGSVSSGAARASRSGPRFDDFSRRGRNGARPRRGAGDETRPQRLNRNAIDLDLIRLFFGLR